MPNHAENCKTRKVTYHHIQEKINSFITETVDVYNGENYEKKT